MDALVSHTLIQRCLEEDKRAQSELYKIMYKSLIGLCWRYASDKEQAIEYMNLGFVRILMNLKQYKPDVPFEMWARRVTINTIINEFRKHKNWNEKMVRNQENLMRQEMNDSDLSDYQQEMLELVRSKALKLPPMTLRVFNLYAIDGYQHTEIAEMLGISEGTSAWHYSDAKKKIRHMLGLNMAKASNE